MLRGCVSRERYYRTGSGCQNHYEFTNPVPDTHYLPPPLAAQHEHVAKATECLNRQQEVALLLNDLAN